MLVDILWAIIIIFGVVFIWTANGFFPCCLKLLLRLLGLERKHLMVKKTNKAKQDSEEDYEDMDLEEGEESTAETDFMDQGE